MASKNSKQFREPEHLHISKHTFDTFKPFLQLLDKTIMTDDNSKRLLYAVAETRGGQMTDWTKVAEMARLPDGKIAMKEYERIGKELEEDHICMYTGSSLLVITNIVCQDSETESVPTPSVQPQNPTSKKSKGSQKGKSTYVADGATIIVPQDENTESYAPPTQLEDPIFVKPKLAKGRCLPAARTAATTIIEDADTEPSRVPAQSKYGKMEKAVDPVHRTSARSSKSNSKAKVGPIKDTKDKTIQKRKADEISIIEEEEADAIPVHRTRSKSQAPASNVTESSESETPTPGAKKIKSALKETTIIVAAPESPVKRASTKNEVNKVKKKKKKN